MEGLNEAKNEKVRRVYKRITNEEVKMYKIEKGVEPPKLRDYIWGQRYPFRMMEVGDSFAFEVNDYTRVSSAMYVYIKKTPPVKFVIKKDGGGYRCWRVR